MASVTAHYPVTKTDKAPTKLATAAATTPVYLSNQDKAEDVEKTLRSFDLETKYGPCTGLSRIQRFERAVKLGLYPPAHVGTLLAQLTPDDPKHANLWAGKV